MDRKIMIASLIVIIMVGCSLPSKNPIIPSETKGPYSVVTLTTPPSATIFQYATRTVTFPLTATATSAPLPLMSSPETNLQLVRDCFELKPQFSLAVEGKIIYKGEWGLSPSFLFDLRTGEKSLFTHNGEGKYLDNFFVSPDYQWFVYRNYKDINNLSPSSILLSTTEGKIHKTIPWQNGWRHIAGWLDSEHILISREVSQYEPDSMIVYNPFSGEHQDLLSNYPNMEMIKVTKGVSSWEGFRYSATAYNPFLSMVVYPKVNEGTFGLALWDVSEKKEIAFLPGNSLFRPKWLTDGLGFVINNTLKPDSSQSDQDGHRELFLIGNNGTVRPLTRLNDFYPKVSIYQFNLSPDERKIAFIISIDNLEPYSNSFPDRNPNDSNRVAILDMETGLITDTCVPGYMLSSLIWSPNSQFLVLHDTYDHSYPPKSHVYFIDLSKRWVYHLTDNVYPVGWLSKNSP